MRRLGTMSGVKSTRHRMLLHETSRIEYGIEKVEPCPLCGYQYSYLGHSHAMGMGIECLKCGLLLSRDFEEFRCPSEQYSEMIALDRKKGRAVLWHYGKWVLEKVVKIWNRRK